MAVVARVELGCAALIALLEIALATLSFLDHFRVSTQLNHASEPNEVILFVLLVHLLPAALVVIGSYAHAVRRKAWGAIVLASGCVAIALWFYRGLYVIAVVMGHKEGLYVAWVALNLSVLAMALVSLILLIIVAWTHRRSNHASE